MKGKFQMWWDGLTVKERMADVAKWSKSEKEKNRSGKVVQWLWRWFAVGCDRDGRMLGPGIAALRKYGKIAGFVWSRALGQGYVQVNPSAYVEMPGKSAKKPAYRKIVDDKMRSICRTFGLYVNVNKWVMEDEALFWVDEPKPDRCLTEREKTARKARRERIKRLPWKKKEMKAAERKREKIRREEEKNPPPPPKRDVDVVVDVLGITVAQEVQA